MNSDSRKAHKNSSALQRANLLFHKPAAPNFPRVGTNTGVQQTDMELVLVADLKSRVSAGIRGFVPTAALA